MNGVGRFGMTLRTHRSCLVCRPLSLDLDSHSSRHTQPPAVPFFPSSYAALYYVDCLFASLCFILFCASFCSLESCLERRRENMAACNQGEEALSEKRYGGIASKKPLISKDHERAYFDSADWVLGKQGTSPKSNTAVESLKPKLKRTPRHQLPPRRLACTTGVEDAE